MSNPRIRNSQGPRRRTDHSIRSPLSRSILDYLAQQMLTIASTKTPMFKSLFVTVACILPCLVLSAFPFSRPLHYRIASDLALKGKGKDGRCMDYAIALSSRLASNGIHGQLIFYRWHIRNTLHQRQPRLCGVSTFGRDQMDRR